VRVTTWQTLLALVLVVGAVSYAGLSVLESRSGTVVPVPSLMWAGIGVIAVVVVLLGRSVRRLTEGKGTRMDALRAARVAMLAKASTLSGAAFAGYFGAQLLIAWTNLGAPALREHAVAAGAAALAGAVLAAAGVVVEHWCRLPPEDDPDPA